MNSVFVLLVLLLCCLGQLSARGGGGGGGGRGGGRGGGYGGGGGQGGGRHRSVSSFGTAANTHSAPATSGHWFTNLFGSKPSISASPKGVRSGFNSNNEGSNNHKPLPTVAAIPML